MQNQWLKKMFGFICTSVLCDNHLLVGLSIMPYQESVLKKNINHSPVHQSAAVLQGNHQQTLDSKHYTLHSFITLTCCLPCCICTSHNIIFSCFCCCEHRKHIIGKFRSLEACCLCRNNDEKTLLKAFVRETVETGYNKMPSLWIMGINWWSIPIQPAVVPKIQTNKQQQLKKTISLRKGNSMLVINKR